jgi:hypothetical protein
MWAQLINTLLGIWLTAAPAVIGYGGAARTNDYIIGPVAASCACIALWEATRPLRWVNLALGLWLLAAPWVLGYEPAALVNSLIVGVLLAAFATVRGQLRHRFNGGWSSLWKSSGEAA